MESPDRGYKLGYEQVGTLLLEENMINETQLQAALARQERMGGKLGKILVDMKFIKEDDLVRFLGMQLDIQKADIRSISRLPEEIIEVVSEDMATKYEIFPINKIGKRLTLAMVDPFDIQVIDDLQVITQCEVDPMIASETEINEAIERCYRAKEESLSDEFIKDIFESHVELKKKEEKEEKLDLEKLKLQVDEAPVVKLVDYIIFNAVKERASDIHIEPLQDRLDIRYRIDGILHLVLMPPRSLQSGIISRIKILSDMDIAERRLPQDGRFTVKLEFREVDLRVATLPTAFGEKIVIRLLRKGPLSQNLPDLGFDEKFLPVFKRYINRPYGMVLLTGPTGSGKTTTLYAALNQITSPEKNIVTLEDPVEYQLKGVYQVQANPGIGLNFASGLRAILRQDPDIIMVGEIRDYETAEMAVRAALTGHLVFSTLHTNDAVGTIVRLINMGIEPFLICSALTMSVAQRLMRRVCPDCVEAFRPTSDMLKGLGLNGSGKDILFYRGKGCAKCKRTGYFGRTGIFEILEVNQRIKDLILQRALPETIYRLAIEQGMTSLREAAVSKVLNGITTFEEVLRVCIDEE